MRRIVPLALLLALAGCGSASTDQQAEGSVAITRAVPHRGSVTRWITGYGSATPSSNGTVTLSVNQPGQVAALLVTPGAMVRAGQPIVTFAVAPSALSGFESASTTLTAAIKQRDTARQLLAQQLATRDQLAQAEKAVADAQAALTAQRREGAGQPVQTLRAPFDGVVTAIPIAIGDRTQPGAPLATIARQGAIVVTVGIDPAERAHVPPGSAARLTRLSGGDPLIGRAIRIDGQLNPATHLVDVDIGFPAGAILTGEALRVELAAGETTGWLVPHASVVTVDQDYRVFQVSGARARAVSVKLLQGGAPNDVVEGLLDGRLPVIVEGAYQIEDGGAVRAR